MKQIALCLLVACGGGSDLGGSAGTGGGTSPAPNAPDVGVLTAGEIDDNKNLTAFLGEMDGSFATIAERAPYDVGDRIELTLRDPAGAPISNATVTLTSERDRIHVVTGTDGRALVLPRLDGIITRDAQLDIAVGERHLRVAAPEGNAWEITVPEVTAELPTGLDLAFVVDATGSMGDEIAYLKAEVGAIAARVGALHEGVAMRYALIVYRDIGDTYVTRSFDFTPDLAQFTSNLGAQAAGGGGDYPEAADAAMLDALALHWRTDNTARIVFQIADAPAHEAGYRNFLDASSIARTRGIRVFPIAASGTAIEAEYLMRMSALMTGGRYLFLTDHSGVGNPHEAPHFPCYQVQRLTDLLARTISSELSGAYVAAEPAEVIDTIGTYRDGACVAE